MKYGVISDEDLGDLIIWLENQDELSNEEEKLLEDFMIYGEEYIREKY